MLLKVTDAGPPDPSVHVTGPVTQAVAAVATTLPSWSAAFPQYIPWVIGVLIGIPGFLFYCVGLWESATVQQLVARWRKRHKARRIVRLRARERVIQAELEAIDAIHNVTMEAKGNVEHARVEAQRAVAAGDVAIERGLLPPKNGPAD